MFDHVKFGVSDLPVSREFFLKALQPLGITDVTDWPPNGVELTGPEGASLCLYQTDEKPAPLHLAFVAQSRHQVQAFYRAALQASAKDNSIFQFRYEPEGTGIRIVSSGRLIGLKGEV